MALAKQASNVIHPMLRLLDGEYDELRRDAVRFPDWGLASSCVLKSLHGNILKCACAPLRITTLALSDAHHLDVYGVFSC